MAAIWADRRWISALLAVGAAVCIGYIGCNSNSPSAVPPEIRVPIASDRFPDATLLIDGLDTSGETVVLEQGREYPFSGSFRVSPPMDDSANLSHRLTLTFLVDRERSGYGEAPVHTRSETDLIARRAREIILGRELVQSVTLTGNDIVEFEGQIEAPKQRTGAVEVRLSMSVPDAEDSAHVVVRTVRVVASSNDGDREGS